MISAITTNGMQMLLLLYCTTNAVNRTHPRLVASWLFTEKAEKIFVLVEGRVVNQLGIYMKLNINCHRDSQDSL